MVDLKEATDVLGVQETPLAAHPVELGDQAQGLHTALVVVKRYFLQCLDFGLGEGEDMLSQPGRFLGDRQEELQCRLDHLRIIVSL